MNAKLIHELSLTVCFLSTFLFPSFLLKYKIRFNFSLVVKLMHLTSVVLAANMTWKFKMQLRRIFTYGRNISYFLRNKEKLCHNIHPSQPLLEFCAQFRPLCPKGNDRISKNICRQKTYKENQDYNARNIDTNIYIYI